MTRPIAYPIMAVAHSLLRSKSESLSPGRPQMLGKKGSIFCPKSKSGDGDFGYKKLTGRDAEVFAGAEVVLL